jgi:hypothetical protein
MLRPVYGECASAIKRKPRRAESEEVTEEITEGRDSSDETALGVMWALANHERMFYS